MSIEIDQSILPGDYAGAKQHIGTIGMANSGFL
jgi:hypothetical protein